MNIGIIGFGKMGSAICRLLAGKSYNITVLVFDEAEAKISEKKCSKWMKRSLRRGTIRHKDTQKEREALKFTCQVENLASAQIIIEAIFEDKDEKVALFNKLESVVDKKALIVSNTSSLSIEQLARGMKHRDRFCGLHFFYPVMLIDLVEIIRCADTSDELVEFLLDFTKDIGKQAITVNDSPGSMINTVLFHYYVEALYILEEVLAFPSKIDAIAKKIFYIGPCESMDVIGIDFFIETQTRIMDWVFHSKAAGPKQIISDIREGYYTPYLFSKLLSENRLGKKVSKGIYLYDKDKPLDDRPDFYRNPAYGQRYKESEKIDKLIETRLLYSIFNGAIYGLERKLSTLEEIDFGIKEGLLMNDGPFTMLQRIGKDTLRENFDFLAHHVGSRFQHNNFKLLND